jgi:glycosyltransferase involved in cell wall biosynthesis
MSRFGGPVVRGFASHMWVPGMYQYEYARWLGFPPNRIVSRLYSAANEQFDTIAAERSTRPPSETILFVGSMWASKGVHELVAAFRQLEERHPSWRLRMVGGGELVDRYRNASPRIEVVGFRQPTELPELFRDAGAFCLPSHAEHWGVVVHEACCAGLPVITADNCGAAAALVHDGYNGFLCRPRSVESLRDALARLMEMPAERRAEFGRRSQELSRQITPKLWAAKFLSVLR